MIITVNRKLHLFKRYEEQVADGSGNFHLQPFIPIQQVGNVAWRKQLKELGHSETDTQSLRYFYRVWTD